jgi:hypothetical protein
MRKNDDSEQIESNSKVEKKPKKKKNVRIEKN